MKTILLSVKPLALLMLILVAFSFTACQKDDVVSPPIKEKLVGTWDVISYKLGGDEYMGFIMDAASLQFEAYTGAEGSFTQQVTFPDEEAASISGPYSFDEEKDKVYMGYDGETIVAKVKITNENDLTWDGSQDGFPLVIKAIRR